MNPDETRRLLIAASLTLSACARHPVPSLQLPAAFHAHGISGNPTFILRQAADLVLSAAHTPSALNEISRYFTVCHRSH